MVTEDESDSSRSDETVERPRKKKSKRKSKKRSRKRKPRADSQTVLNAVRDYGEGEVESVEVLFAGIPTRYGDKKPKKYKCSVEVAKKVKELLDAGCVRVEKECPPCPSCGPRPRPQPANMCGAQSMCFPKTARR